MSGIWDDVRVAIGLEEGRPRQQAKHAPGQHAPRVPFALLVVTLVAGGLGLLLLLNTASAANEVRRHDLAAQDASVAAQLQELQNEVAASAAPGNLAQAAAQLGMVPAGHPAFLVVGTDGSVTVMGHPKRVAGALDVNIPAKTSAAPETTRATPTPTSPDRNTSTSAGSRRTAGERRHASATPTTTRTTPSPSPTPSPTPTPTLTLSGGNR